MTAVGGFFLGLLGGAMYGAIVLVAAGLAPGGTWLWMRGLWFVAGAALVSAIGSAWLSATNPAALKVRLQNIYPDRCRCRRTSCWAWCAARRRSCIGCRPGRELSRRQRRALTGWCDRSGAIQRAAGLMSARLTLCRLATNALISACAVTADPVSALKRTMKRYGADRLTLTGICHSRLSRRGWTECG